MPIRLRRFIGLAVDAGNVAILAKSIPIRVAIDLARFVLLVMEVDVLTTRAIGGVRRDLCAAVGSDIFSLPSV